MKKNYFISTGYQPKNKNTTLPSNSVEKVKKAASLNNDLSTISPLTITTRQFPPAIRQWVNSVYNFNKNYIKNLPAVDNIVNNIIKSFFTINPLAYNPGGKKSRLLQRRYKKLSLNTILVSKSEIKHSNDKVYITVYLFNKKKRSLLNKLNQIYNTISFKNFSYFDQDQNSNNKKKYWFNTYFYKSMLYRNKVIKQKKLYRKMKSLSKKLRIVQPFLNAVPSFYGKMELNRNLALKKNLLVGIAHKGNKDNKGNKQTAVKNLLNVTKQYKFSNKSNKSVNTFLPKNLGSYSTSSRNFKQKLYYYKNLNNLTKNSIYKFFTLALLKSRDLAKANTLKQTQKLDSAPVENITQSLFILQALDLLKSQPVKSLAKNKTIKNLEKYITQDVNISQLSLKKRKYYTALRNNIVNKSLNTLAYSSIVKDYYYDLNKYKLYRGPVSSKANTVKANNITSAIYLDTQNNVNLSTYWQEAMLKIRTIVLPIANLASNVEKPTLLNAEKELLANTGSLKNTLFFNSISMHKLKALYKLFTLYNNIHNVELLPKQVRLGINDSVEHAKKLSFSFLKKEKNILVSSEKPSLYSSKIIWNTYKLLKKSLIVNIQLNKRDKENTDKLMATDTSQREIVQNGEAVLQMQSKKNAVLGKHNITNSSPYRYISIDRLNGVISRPKGGKNKKPYVKKFLKTSLSTLEVRKRKKSFNSIQRVMKNITLINSINKIDRFFNKYKNLNASLNPQKTIGLTQAAQALNNWETTVSSIYKLTFIKEFLDKELVYLYYVKLLSFNNTIFKNWFLNSLKNIISKIYNKKVVFNLINLKYIHLNTDILLQAIKIRLRNFKKNRVTKVLRRALKLVKLSKMNVFACDIHSPIYKYIEQHFNNFKGLNLEIFKNANQSRPYKLSKLSASESNATEQNTDLTAYYTPSKIRRLNHVQASTINFIKYKSVFGVRLEGAGRLTKRSTASRSIFKFKYKGTLKNNVILNRTASSVILNNNRISNLQFTKISSKTRNGSYGLKGWINSN